MTASVIYLILHMLGKSKKNKTSRVKRLIRQTVIPNEKNEFRPHIIRRYGLLVVFLTVIGAQFIYNGITADLVSGKKTDITIESLLDSTNIERQKADLPLLTINHKLNQAASSKAQDMFKKQYWAHVSPDGVQPWKWLEEEKYYFNKAGENLAKDYSSTNAVINAWMNSVEHKKNILNPEYQDVGFAVVDGEYMNESAEFIVAFYGLSSGNAIANSHKSFMGAVLSTNYDIWSRFKVAVRSITPLTIVCLGIILIAIIISIWSHFYRHKLPDNYRKNWKRHHGLYKSIGLFAFFIVTILISASGQI